METLIRPDGNLNNYRGRKKRLEGVTVRCPEGAYLLLTRRQDRDKLGGKKPPR